MLEMLAPGVYPTEVDLTETVQSASTSVFGTVGVFERGPVGEPVLVTSFEDAKRRFGNYVDGYFGLLALKHFFENGGSRAQVVRTVKYTAGVAQASSATATLVDRDATVPLDTLRVDAINPGSWGNKVSVSVEASVADPAAAFNIVVKEDGVTVETFADLYIGSSKASSEDYCEKRVNGASRFITITDLLSATAAPNNRPATGSTALASGTDGLTGIAAADFVGNAADKNGLYALDVVDVNFIAIPGESDEVSGADIADGLLTYAESRKDCIAIVETPADETTATGMKAFRDGSAPYNHSAFNSSFGALYGPWLVAKHPVTGRETDMPPAGFVAGIFARSDAQDAVWAAPAGQNRATVRGATRPVVRLSKSEQAVVYPAGVNAIAPVSGALVVNGQRTLQLKASATDRVNVRRLMAFIERSVTDAAQSLVFEANDRVTWERFKRLVNPFLRRVKDGGGLYNFTVICDETINTPDVIQANILKARILVQPTYTAEFIAVEFAISSPGELGA